MSNATVLNVPDLNKTKSKLRDIRSPTVEARCTSVQSFNQAGDLWRRIVTHSKERAYNCDQCNKSFGVAGSLKTHMLAQSGVKNHTCSECGKSFGQSGHLRRKYTNFQNDSFGLAEHLKNAKGAASLQSQNQAFPNICSPTVERGIITVKSVGVHSAEQGI